jgi:hypothetical protein
MKKAILATLFAVTAMTVVLARENYGKLPEVRRNVSPLALSGPLQKGLKAYYDAHWVIDLVQITKGDAKAYYVTLEGPDDKIMMKSVAGGTWEIISVLSKNGNTIISK